MNQPPNLNKQPPKMGQPPKLTGNPPVALPVNNNNNNAIRPNQPPSMIGSNNPPRMVQPGNPPILKTMGPNNNNPPQQQITSNPPQMVKGNPPSLVGGPNTGSIPPQPPNVMNGPSRLQPNNPPLPNKQQQQQPPNILNPSHIHQMPNIPPPPNNKNNNNMNNTTSNPPKYNINNNPQQHVNNNNNNNNNSKQPPDIVTLQSQIKHLLNQHNIHQHKNVDHTFAANLPSAASIPPALPVPTIQLNEQDPAKMLTALEMERRTINHLQLLYTSEIARLEHEAQIILDLIQQQDPALIDKLHLTSKVGSGLPQCSGKAYFDLYGQSLAQRDVDGRKLLPTPPQEHQYVPHLEIHQPVAK